MTKLSRHNEAVSLCCWVFAETRIILYPLLPSIDYTKFTFRTGCVNGTATNTRVPAPTALSSHTSP